MVVEQSRQLALGVRLDDDATFDNFHVSAGNRVVVTALQDPAQPVILVWGNLASGRTHLLQAACHREDGQSIYIPGTEKSQLDPAILDEVEQLQLVCIDDVESIAGDPDWEQALFHAINTCNGGSTRLLLSANAPPGQLAIDLPDLQSRLQQALVFHLHDLNDTDKLAAFRFRATKRGMTVPLEVGEYIMQRSERSLAVLMDILERLDSSSLERQRRITIPLVKATLDW
ncbi:MAG: DnaA regulatory inactivator Hda [Gammaproteobacteria bacterium]